MLERRYVVTRTSRIRATPIGAQFGLTFSVNVPMGCLGTLSTVPSTSKSTRNAVGSGSGSGTVFGSTYGSPMPGGPRPRPPGPPGRPSGGWFFLVPRVVFFFFAQATPLSSSSTSSPNGTILVIPNEACTVKNCCFPRTGQQEARELRASVGRLATHDGHSQLPRLLLCRVPGRTSSAARCVNGSASVS